MKVLLGILIAVCGAAAVYMAVNTMLYWKKSADMPFEKRAKGLQIRMTIIPVLLMLIIIFAVIIRLS